jgi:GT2 family glycosyltransferase
MYYRFEEFRLNAQGEMEVVAPTPVDAKKQKVAIVIHLYYADLWSELYDYLKQIDVKYDLFITLPQHADEAIVKRILSDMPHAHLYRVENRGRDVLPFLLVMRHIGWDRYDYICKLHTKKTGESPLGSVWRKLLYFDLIGSDETVRKIVESFDNNPDIGMVTGKNTILDSRLYDYGNTTKIDRLIDEAGYLFQDSYVFAGGTMFWMRTSLLEPVMRLFEAGKLEFEEEKGQKDNTIAHALERFFGIVCKVEGYRIVPSPTHYSQLDDETLDEVASLVLSQNYRGEDAFAYQNAIIKQLNEANSALHRRIDELEELADLKRRFKKSLKRYTPEQLWRILQITKRVIWTLRHNPALFKKAWFYLKRGDIGYLLRKIKEKSEGNLKRGETLHAIVPQHMFKRFIKSDFTLGDHVIDIIIPVYNGYEFLPKLFDSLQRHTTTPYRLIVVHDASSDERVLPYLKERLTSFEDVVLIEHEHNAGFVKSVNEAVAHTRDHFVILNTDTEVPAFWLERLMYPIVAMEKVASTTPFTNAGTIASFPNFLEDNPIFENLDVDTLDRVFRYVNPQTFYEEVPTGVGFCMGVNRTLVKEIGFFDEEAFGKGYGEENDWCQRAIKAGWRNLLVPNLFVYHKHGGSFASEQKRRLMEENSLKLLERYPDYDKEVQAYIARDPHKVLREVLVMLASSKKGRGLTLVFDHALGGGANLYARERIERYINEGKKTVRIAYDYYGGYYEVRFRYCSYDLGFRVELAEGLATLFEPAIIEEIFVNSLVSYKETAAVISLIKTLKEIHHAELIVPVHDFYPVCPNFTLVDESGTYCEVPDDKERCAHCLATADAEWRSFGDAPMDIVSWRKLWDSLLQEADTILCFSKNSCEIMQKAYPALPKERYEVQPHHVKALPPVQLDISPHSNQRIKLGVLGAINRAKGADIVKALVSRIEKERLPIDVVLIGEISEPIRSKHFKITGRYERHKLPEIVRDEKVDIFLIPSVCPETFSYTTEEIMMMRMPLMVFPVGAPAERVASYEKGVVLESISVDAVIAYVQKIYGSDATT